MKQKTNPVDAQYIYIFLMMLKGYIAHTKELKAKINDDCTQPLQFLLNYMKLINFIFIYMYRVLITNH